MISVENISLRLGAFHVKDVSFTVPAESYMVLLGPTGAGKTVVVETLLGLHRPDVGTALNKHRRETVTQCMASDPLFNSGIQRGLADRPL